MAASGVSESDIVLNVTAASVNVIATIAMRNSSAASSAASTLQAVDQAGLSTQLGVTIERVGSVRTYTASDTGSPPSSSLPPAVTVTVAAQAASQSSDLSQQDDDLIVSLLVAVLVLLAILVLAASVFIVRWLTRGRMSMRKRPTGQNSDPGVQSPSKFGAMDDLITTTSNSTSRR